MKKNEFPRKGSRPSCFLPSVLVVAVVVITGAVEVFVVVVLVDWVVVCAIVVELDTKMNASRYSINSNYAKIN